MVEFVVGIFRQKWHVSDRDRGNWDTAVCDRKDASNKDLRVELVLGCHDSRHVVGMLVFAEN